MFVVIFEVQPNSGTLERLSRSRQIPEAQTGGDRRVHRQRSFRQQAHRERVLSLSTWRDEKAVVRWRTQGEHHRVQEKGRFEIFEDYRIRVGEVTADTAPPDGLPLDQQRFDATATGDAKAVSITELAPSNGGSGVAAERLAAELGLPTGTAGLVDHEVFESIYNPGKLLLLAAWRDAPSAEVGGCRQSRRKARCGIGGSASFATTACANAARRRNSIPRCSGRAAAQRNNRGRSPPNVHRRSDDKLCAGIDRGAD